MATSGPNFPSTGADDSTVGSITWTNPGNILSDDGVNAQAVGMGNGAISHYLKATGFGFSIPAGATILGILVEWQTSNAVTNGTYNSVKIVKGGTISGTDQAASQAQTAGTYVSFGGSSNLWGLTWTATDINASNFGVVMSTKQGSTDAGQTHTVDVVRITITYTPAAANTEAVDSSISNTVFFN